MKKGYIGTPKNTTIKTKSKQITFFATVLLTIGSTIGAGIFIKNSSILGNVHNSLLLAISCWVITGIACLMMGLALVEVCSAKGLDQSLGIVGWVKKYTNEYLYKAFRNFYGFLYLPFLICAIAFFSIQFLAEGLNWNIPWWTAVLLVFAIVTWFTFTSAVSSRSGDLQNKVFVLFKFFPIVIAAVIGFVYVGMHHGSMTPLNPHGDSGSTPLLDKINPAVGVIASIPAILFAYNGFFNPASEIDNMKKPQSAGSALGLGIAIITFIYIIIALSLMLFSNSGKLDQDNGNAWGGIKGLNIFIEVIQVIIAVTILSCINGTFMTFGKYYQGLIARDEAVFSKKIKAKFNNESSKTLVGATYGYVLMMAVLLFVTIVGLFFVNNLSSNSPIATAKAQGIFSFSDLMSNWCALFIFLGIAASIIGMILNRKTKKIDNTKAKGAIVGGWVAVIVIGISVLYTLVSVFYNIALVVYYKVDGDYASNSDFTTNIVTVVLTLVTLIFFAFVMFGLPLIKTKIDNKKKKVH